MSKCDSKGAVFNWVNNQNHDASPQTKGAAQAVYRIENMDCPTEEALIRSKLAGLEG